MKKQSKELNTSCIAYFPNGNTKEFSSINEASEFTGESVNTIKIRCNKSDFKDKKKINFKWLDDYTRRHFQAKKSSKKGKNYELDIIHELTDLGYEGLKSSRSESRNMDNNHIDICDTQNQLNCYIQCKATKNTPNIEEITKGCPLKDKPLIVMWKKQDSSLKNHEYVILPKKYFYELLNNNK